MKAFCFVLHLSALLGSVLSSLPEPVNPIVNSTNFHHVLCWDPGPGTPPGTHYQILQRGRGKPWKNLLNSTTTCVQLHLSYNGIYDFTVQASNNRTFSERSSIVHFRPFENTKIEPPHLSVAGCGSCIQINISVPEAKKNSVIVDMQEIYGASFQVMLRKKNDDKSVEITKTEKNFTLFNLESGVEYCVQVHMKTRLNRNTEPSAWSCTFTSPVEPGTGPAVFGAVAALLMFGILIVAVNVLCLHYTGFLCKPKAPLPTVLNLTVNHGCILTPEMIIPDPLILSTDTGEVNKHNSPTKLCDETMEANSETEDESEKENSTHLYMDRDLDLSSRETSCQVSGNVLQSNTDTSLGHSGSLAEVLSAQVEVLKGELDEGSKEAEGLEESSLKEWSLTEVKDEVATQAEEIKVEDFEHFSGDVDLFSVRIAALDVEAAVEEDKEQIGEEHLTEDCLEPLLSTDRKWTLSDTDYQSKAGTTSLVPEGVMNTEYEGMHDETEEEEEEEEEEEQYSEYLGHR